MFYSSRKIFISLSSIAIVFAALALPQSASADTTATLLPTSDGNYLQWTPNTGTSHFALVDESSCNGVTDYNSETTVGQRDSYGINVSSIPNGSTITQIVLTPCASRVNTGGTNPVMNLFYRLNGVDSADAGAYSLIGTTPTVLGSTTFSGLATVKGAGTTLEFGAVLTSSTKGARLSQLSGVITYTPLASPSGLSAQTLSTESAKITWVDNATNETGYSVERGTDSAHFTLIRTLGANSTSYVDQNVFGTFYYRVKATNAGGDSAYSNTASTTVTLNAPTALNVSALSTEAAQLTWTDNSKNETGYKIERGTDGVNFTQINTVSANKTSYIDPNVIGTYYYRVRAYKTGVADSNYSNVTSVTLNLNAPTSLNATNSSNSALLSWTDQSNNEDGFKIERSTDNINFSQIDTVGVNGNSYTDPTLPSGTYYYRVKAYKSIIDSSYSNSASVIIP